MLLTTVGIDPGRQGGIAFVTGTEFNPFHSCRIKAYPQPDFAWNFDKALMEEAKLPTIRGNCSMDENLVFFLEKPLTLPHDGGKRSITIGCNFGYWIGKIYQYNQFPRLRAVSPRTWQAFLGISGKDESTKFFRELFSFEELAYDATLVDAALIAYYGQCLRCEVEPTKRPIEEKIEAVFVDFPFQNVSASGKENSSNGSRRKVPNRRQQRQDCGKTS